MGGGGGGCQHQDLTNLSILKFHADLFQTRYSRMNYKVMNEKKKKAMANCDSSIKKQMVCHEGGIFPCASVQHAAGRLTLWTVREGERHSASQCRRSPGIVHTPGCPQRTAPSLHCCTVPAHSQHMSTPSQQTCSQHTVNTCSQHTVNTHSPHMQSTHM